MGKLLTLVCYFLGLILAFSIPGLWIAWTPGILWLVLGSGVGAAVLYMLIYPGSSLSRIGQR